MTDHMLPPRLAEAVGRLTTQLVLAELRAHHRAAGPFAWLDAGALANRTPVTPIGPRQLAVDSALRLLQRTRHIELTHLPPRMPPHTGADHPTQDTDTLHARLALTPRQTHQEHDNHTAALRTIAARLGPLILHGRDDATPNSD